MNATELIDGLRDVGNLHEFAELFGFDWTDDSEWTWHDVAVKMADELEQAIAATLGNHEIVRCRDCIWFTNSPYYGAYCTNFGSPLGDDYDGFCKWGERE